MCVDDAVVWASQRSPSWVFCPPAGEFKNSGSLFESLFIVAPHMF